MLLAHLLKYDTTICMEIRTRDQCQRVVRIIATLSPRELGVDNPRLHRRIRACEHGERTLPPPKSALFHIPQNDLDANRCLRRQSDVEHRIVSYLHHELHIFVIKLLDDVRTVSWESAPGHARSTGY